MQMPNYLEFTTTDMGASKAFYGAAFGFEFVEYGPEYAGVNGDGIEIGLARSDEGRPPRAGFQTQDIEASLKSVREAGGDIIRETYDFPGGKRFHFRDPGGNELLVYQYDA